MTENIEDKTLKFLQFKGISNVHTMCVAMCYFHATISASVANSFYFILINIFKSWDGGTHYLYFI